MWIRKGGRVDNVLLYFRDFIPILGGRVREDREDIFGVLLSPFGGVLDALKLPIGYATYRED